MDASSLIQIAQDHYGDRGWQRRIAERLGVDTSTIRRWCYKDYVPGPARAALEAMKKELRRERRKAKQRELRRARRKQNV